MTEDCDSCDALGVFKQKMVKVSPTTSASSKNTPSAKQEDDPWPIQSPPGIFFSKAMTFISHYIHDIFLDVMELGRSSWTLLHTLSAYYPKEPSLEKRRNVEMFLRMFAQVYPCRYVNRPVFK